MWPGGWEEKRGEIIYRVDAKKKEATSGGYHATGPDAPRRASSKHERGSRRGFNDKVVTTIDFPVGEFRFVGCHRVSKREWRIEAADTVG